MTETMDRKDNSSDADRADTNGSDTDHSNDDRADDDQGIIELTDIIDEIVEDDGNGKMIDQSYSTPMPEGGMDSVDGGPLSDDAIEAALLRLVEKKYAGQLDALFAGAVERVVKREIEAVKKSLLKDI